MHSPAKKCAASRHVIIYSLQLTKSNRIKVTQIMKCLVFLTLVLLEIGTGPGPGPKAGKVNVSWLYLPKNICTTTVIIRTFFIFCKKGRSCFVSGFSLLSQIV